MSAARPAPEHRAPEASDAPVLRFIAGNPTPEEIAAVSAVLLAAGAETESAAPIGRARRAQNRRARLGLRLRPGLGAWRRTMPSR